MKYYRVNSDFGLWIPHKNNHTERMEFLKNSLYTEKELCRIARVTPEDKLFKSLLRRKFGIVEVSKFKTYTFFGARFEDGTDWNTKF